MPRDLVRAFSIRNLQLAWKRTLTSDARQFKDYFRDVYRAYSLASDANLADLHNRLDQDTFEPRHAIKLYIPKSSGILRVYSLLSIEDQIVYQAFANIIAAKLLPRVRSNYYKCVFGNLLTAPSNMYFFRSWKTGLTRLQRAIRTSFAHGNKYTASFDLTACFDSIDHKVLTYFLTDLNLDREFCSCLCAWLSHWTASSAELPIYQGHGIPVGPQPSRLLAECVLRHFDSIALGRRPVRYFRYVDDIRLMARSERDLREALVRLDLKSKEIGLFPQSSKIRLHLIKNIGDVTKGVSHPPEPSFRNPAPDQEKIRARLRELTPRFRVTDETRFKFVLAAAIPKADLTKRMLTIAEKQIHLYRPIFEYLDRSGPLSPQVSAQCMKVLRENDLYPAYSAALIRALLGRLHDSCKREFEDYCFAKLDGPKRSKNAEVRAAVAAVLLESGVFSWKKTEALLSNEEWWAKVNLLKHVRKDLVGPASYEILINNKLRDDCADVATVAAETLILDGLTVQPPTKEIQKAAQLSLRAAGLIGRVQGGKCPIADAMEAVLGKQVHTIDWRHILGAKYKTVLQRIVPWRGYSNSDPSAWVNMTDTIDDLVLDVLFTHDPAIGSYTLGKIGSVLTSKGRFALKYPKLFNAADAVHQARLQSDLSHLVVHGTGRMTRRITFEEMDKLKKKLRNGYVELWTCW